MSRFLFLLLFVSCAHSPQPKDLGSQEIYNQIKKLSAKKDWTKALELIKELKSPRHLSLWVQKTKNFEADIYFEKGEYKKAREIYLTLLPSYKNNQKLLYRIGLSYFNELPSRADKDISVGFKARPFFKKILKIKNSTYKVSAQKKLAKILELELEKEYQTSLLYIKMDLKDQARQRLELLIKTYPEHAISQKAQQLLKKWKG